MASAEFVFVIVFKEWSEERSELIIRIWTATVDSDSRVCVLTSRKDRFSEAVVKRVFLVLELVPDFACEELAEQRLVLAWWECWVPLDVRRCL